jgi:effector-binding domain-containing protein
MALFAIYMLSALVAQTPDGAPEISIQKFEAAEVVFTVHNGPYWRAGTAVRELAEFMADRGQPGPMFTRFVGRKGSSGAYRRTEIGFFVKGPLTHAELDGLYERKLLPAYEAATLTLDVPYGKSFMHHVRVLDWIKSQGLTAGDEVVEVYPSSSRDLSIVELRVVIARTPKIVEPAPTVEVGALTKLAASGDYAEIARRVIPDESKLQERHKAWLTEWVDRLGVIRVMADMKYGAEAKAVDDIISPIVERARWLRRAPVQAKKTPTSLSDIAIAKRKAALLRELDRVMVKVHTKTLPSGDVVAVLIEEMTKAVSVLESTGLD